MSKKVNTKVSFMFKFVHVFFSLFLLFLVLLFLPKEIDIQSKESIIALVLTVITFLLILFETIYLLTQKYIIEDNYFEVKTIFGYDKINLNTYESISQSNQMIFGELIKIQFKNKYINLLVTKSEIRYLEKIFYKIQYGEESFNIMYNKDLFKKENS